MAFPLIGSIESRVKTQFRQSKDFTAIVWQDESCLDREIEGFLKHRQISRFSTGKARDRHSRA
jgi:hypothetical protein